MRCSWGGSRDPVPAHQAPCLPLSAQAWAWRRRCVAVTILHAGTISARFLPPCGSARVTEDPESQRPPQSLRRWWGEGLLLPFHAGRLRVSWPWRSRPPRSLHFLVCKRGNALPSPRGLLRASWRFETGTALESSWDRQRGPACPELPCGGLCCRVACEILGSLRSE